MVGKRQRNRYYHPAPWYRHLGPDYEKQRSIAMRQFARSWRGCLVGGSGIGRKLDGSYVQLSGFNTKAARGPRKPGDKCAAMRILEDAEAKACVVVEMWEAYSEPQVDDASKLDLGHLISCVYCRRIFKRERRKPREQRRILDGTIINYVDVEKPDRSRPFTVERILRICS